MRAPTARGALGAFALVACGPLVASTLVACEPLVTTPRARMARELACTEDRTKLLRLADGEKRRVRAHGCGRVATYVCDAREECWREGPVEDAPNGPPPNVALE